MNSYVRPKVADYVEAAPGAAEGDRRDGRRQHPPLRRRADDDARGGAQPDLRRPLGPVGRRRRRALRRRARRATTNILTFDMGGTSTDVALCQNGEPTIGRETSISHFRIKVPSRERAHGRRGRRLDRPRAGADEGAPRRPAVGGRRARPGRLRQGRHRADRDRRERRPRPPAAAAARRRDGARRRGGARRPCRRSPTRWASTRSSRPPRGSSRSSTRTWPARCGSSRSSAATTRATSRSSPTAAPGPLHANAVAKLMGSFPVIVPPAPGLLCAIGDLVADFRDEFARTLHPARLDEASRRRGRGHPRRARRARAARGSTARASPTDAQRIAYIADMRYHRQGYEIPVALDPAEVRANGLGDLEERFNALHEQLYGFRMHETRERDRQPARGRLRRRAEAGAADRRARRGRTPSAAVVDEHEIVFDGERVPTKIYDRSKLEPGAPARGPGDRDRVRLDDRRPPRLRGRGRRALQHPDHTRRRAREQHGSRPKSCGSPRSRPTSRSTRSRSTSSRAR